MNNILAVIPARGGSKGILRKNIKLFRGKPLIYWSIKQAQESKLINRIIVSTDSSEIAHIAKEYGAEVPFLRPSEISHDLSTDYEFMLHLYSYLKEKWPQLPNIIVQLRPTYPTRKSTIIDETIKIFQNNFNDYDSLRTVILSEKTPYKMYNIQNEILIPLFKEVNGIIEPYNSCRQSLPNVYLHNGYIDILKPDIIVNKNSISGTKIYPYVLPNHEIHDLDSEIQWEKAEKLT